MAESNARFMKRKVKAGTIEIDAEACALVVNYEVEATVLGDMGEPIIADRKQNQKLIRLKTLNERTDIPRLADDILEKCKLIPEAKRGTVEDLLRQLQHAQYHGTAPRRSGADGAGGSAAADRPDASAARLDRLGDYIDQCYEGIEASIEATGMLLALAREPSHMQSLIGDDRLLGCLTRLLNDEGKKSTDLAITIVSILYAISVYSDFHDSLLEFKVGSMVMDVVDLEIKRHALRERERARAAADGAAEDARRERVRVRKGERLLYVAFHVLLNLSEDPNTERKMVNHGIVPMLIAMLGRQNADLLILVVAFLKKLSIFSENAAEMAKARLADRLIPFVPNQHEGLLEQVLRLLFNLSFHPKCRAQMGRAGLTPKLLSLLRKGRHRLLAVRLLYKLSALDDERVKMTQSVPMLVGTVVNTPDASLVPPEVLALLVNLMTSVENAAACARARGALRGLVTLAVRGQHALALKVLRNVARHHEHDWCEELARAYAGSLLDLARHAESADVQFEAIGLLAELPLELLDELPDLLIEHNALELLHTMLMPGFAADDVILEAVRLSAVCAGHAGCVPLLVRAGRLLPALITTLDDKQEDDEIVVAVLWAFYRLLFNEEAREIVLHETQLVTHVLELLYDNCAAVRQQASAVLDLVAEHDSSGQWGAQIRERKFQLHNSEWLDAIEEDEVEQYEEAMAINEALSKVAVHDVSELEEAAAAGELDVSRAGSGRSRLSYDEADEYGAEYGLDMESPGVLSADGRAYGALSEEAYLSLGAQDGEYDDDYEEDEEL